MQADSPGAGIIECRPQGGSAIAVFLLLLVGGFFCGVPAFALSERHDRDTILIMGFSFCFGALWLVGAVYGLLFQMRARIIADPQKLSWRGALGWRSVYWEEVEDYYTRRYPKGGTYAVVESTAGKLSVGATAWTQVAALRAQIEARATRARAKAWGLQGCRPEDDWPRLFVYDVEKNRRALWWFGSLLACLLSMPLLIWATRSDTAKFGPGWQWTLAACGLMELLMALYVMVYATILHDYRDALRRRNERILVDAQGLAFEDERRRLKIAWSDIRDWKVGRRRGGLAARSLYTIRTETDTIEFTRYIQDAGILVEVINIYLGRKPARSEEEMGDALDGPLQQGVDSAVYSYRTRTNRALLLLPIFMAIVSLAPFLRPYYMEQSPPLTPANAVFQGLFSACFWAAALLFLARYRIARIETDAEGITERRLFSVRRLTWEEIQSYAMCKDSFAGHAELIGAQGKIRFGWTIAHLDQLKIEIARRAIHSRNQEWNDLSDDGDKIAENTNVS